MSECKLLLLEELDLAYLAGIIDGEGCLRIMKHPSCNQFSPHVYVTNTDPRLIDWLQTNWGGSVNIRQLKPTWKPAMLWRLTGEAAINLIKSILPFLKLKREQADILLSLWRLKESFGVGPGYTASEDYVESASVLKEAIRILNSRGIQQDEVDRTGKALSPHPNRRGQ